MLKFVLFVAVTGVLGLARGQAQVSTLIRSDITGSDVDCGQGGARCRICGDINAITSSCSSNPACVAFTFDGSCGFLKSASGPTAYREGYTTFVLSNKGAAPPAGSTPPAPPAQAAAIATPAAAAPVQVAAPSPSPSPSPPASPAPAPAPTPAPAPAPTATPPPPEPRQVSAGSEPGYGTTGYNAGGGILPIGFGGFGFPVGRRLLRVQQA